MTDDSKATPVDRPATSFDEVPARLPDPEITRPLPGAPVSERRLFAGAIAVGVMADLLAFQRPAGVGLTITLVAALALVGALQGRLGLRLASRNRWLYIGLIAALAVTFSVRTAESLLALNGVMVFMAAVLLSTRISGRRLRDAGTVELSLALLEVPATSGIRAGAMISRVFRFSSSDHSATGARGFGNRHGRDIAIGVLIAIPVLAIFGVLLAASDAGFKRLLGDLFDWDFASAIEHAYFIVIGGFAAATVAVAALASDPTTHMKEVRGNWAGPAVVWIVLGSTAALFALFLAVQGSYLFGGTDYLQERTGLTAAQYARHGFYELLVVSGLTVALLLGTRASFSLQAGSARAYRVLAPALSGLTIVLVLSALARMSIYADRFGLTEQRIYAITTLIWIGIVLAWLGVRVALDRPLQIATFAGTAAIGVVLLLNIVNPHALSARTNLDRRGADGTHSGVDVDYLLALSPDATPAIVNHLERLSAADQRRVMRRLREREHDRSDDWRSANLATTRADEALDDQG